MQKQRSAVFSANSCQRFSYCWLLSFLLLGIASAFHLFSGPSSTATLSVLFATDSASSSMADSVTIQSTSTDNTSCNNNYNNRDTGDMRFGRFLIPEASIFCRTSRAAAFVNLRPIVPGHVLVVPNKIVPLMADLEENEYTALWSMVRKVQSTLQKAYPETTAFNVAVQDGRAAGQSVPHVHVHILPRSSNDFERNDDVYDALEAWAPTEAMVEAKKPSDIAVPDDSERMDRTSQEMADEAAMYRKFQEKAE